ncbi:MAG TPA: arsinothricin resistance N-acetyltransferase ArsN1 family B [Acidimicrobiales bacterium]|nr:arsinothricin resistance N-acetyltransferase ArsN1 family B [Acidimicrobiales bacterium]
MYVRMATADDAAAMLAIYGPVVESTAISFEVEVPSIEEMAARITKRQPAYPWLVGEAGDRVTGYAYAGPFSGRAAYDWSVETSVYVAEDWRGRGVGRALYRALFELLGLQGFRRAMAGVTLPNPASVALHEGAGFTPVGVYRSVGWKFGDWHDVGWWQRGIGAAEGRPTPPRPLTEVPAGTLEAALARGHLPAA